jgi:hypothetical protein
MRSDAGSRAAYATDASGFRQTPIGVVRSPRRCGHHLPAIPGDFIYTVVESGNTGATTSVVPETHHS